MSQKQQIEEMKQLITEKLLDNLRNPEKTPRASMLGTAISWVKAVDPTLGTQSPEELRQSLEQINRALASRPSDGDGEEEENDGRPIIGVHADGTPFRSRIKPMSPEEQAAKIARIQSRTASSSTSLA